MELTLFASAALVSPLALTHVMLGLFGLLLANLPLLSTILSGIGLVTALLEVLIHLIGLAPPIRLDALECHGIGLSASWPPFWASEVFRHLWNAYAISQVSAHRVFDANLDDILNATPFTDWWHRSGWPTNHRIKYDRTCGAPHKKHGISTPILTSSANST